MNRIGGPLRQVRIPTAQADKPATTASKASIASKLAGFSNLSSFGGASATSSSTAAASTASSTPFNPLEPFGRAPTGARKLSPNDLGVLAQDQGRTNACGTTSLANVMTHWGVPRTHQDIDKSIRAFDMFTAPDKLVQYARDNGMRAEMKTDAKLDDIARMIDQGVPPIVLLDPDSDDNFNLHYVTVSGYNRDANGKISELVIADSAGGRRYTMSAEEFQKQWDNLKLKNVSTGLNNVMITVMPKSGNITGGDGVVRRASDIKLPRSSFFSNLKSGLARGVANLLTNVTGFAQKAWNTAKAVGSAVGKVANAVGNAARAVGSAVGNAARAVGNTAKRVWKSIFG
jgi:hypothetical protein